MEDARIVRTQNRFSARRAHAAGVETMEENARGRMLRALGPIVRTQNRFSPPRFRQTPRMRFSAPESTDSLPRTIRQRSPESVRSSGSESREAESFFRDSFFRAHGSQADCHGEPDAEPDHKPNGEPDADPEAAAQEDGTR